MSTPYATGALKYSKSGIGWPIPSAFPFEKHPPISGYTGRRGQHPSMETVQGWIETHPNSNLLLRLTPGVVGLDVDDYGEKHGGRTLSGIADQHGPLAQAPRSTARHDDLTSGIRFYALSMYMDESKMRDPGEHVEVIRYSHRYAVAAPSWHQGVGATYRWYFTEGDVPTYDELPPLPFGWYTHLARGCDCFAMERVERRAMLNRVRNRPPGRAGAEAARSDLTKAAGVLHDVPKGSRNNTLSSMAGRFLMYDFVLNGVLAAEEILDRLSEAAIDAGLPPYEVERTLDSALNWAIQEREEVR